MSRSVVVMAANTGRSWWKRELAPAPAWALLAGGLVALLVAASFQFRLVAERRIPQEGWRWDRVPPVQLLVQLPAVPRRVAADLLWVRVIQCYGYHRQTDHVFDALEAHFDAVTRVDPLFEQAYAFGGLVLAQDAGRPEVGVDLLRRGMGVLPESWRLPFEVGFIYYVDMGDPRRAARYFDLASMLPDAPGYVKHFAAYAYLRAGQRDMARCFWIAIFQETTSDAVRRLAIEALQRMDAEDRQGAGAPPAIPGWTVEPRAPDAGRSGT